MLCKPVTKPRFGSEIAQLQRGFLAGQEVKVHRWSERSAHTTGSVVVLVRGNLPGVGPTNGHGDFEMERGFAVIGLGYVGLPVALALANNFAPVIGFDISKRRIV